MFVMRRNKRPKYAERLWTQRLFNSGVQHELHVDDCSGFRNFPRMTESDFVILLLNIGPRSQRKDTNFREAIFFCDKINRVTFLITVFVIYTMRIQ
jgi:hypothetical protein